MNQKSFAHYIAKALVDVMFYGGIVCIFFVPWIAKFLKRVSEYNEAAYDITMVTLFASGICSVYILLNLKKMFKTLIGGNPFIEINVQCLRKIAVACGVISLIYAVKCVLAFTIASVAIVLVFAVGALFCLTLKDIFKQAIFYKEEHDWTV